MGISFLRGAKTCKFVSVAKPLNISGEENDK
jgi:hypothetical protein